MSPPWAWMKPRAMARPRPLPPRVVAGRQRARQLLARPRRPPVPRSRPSSSSPLRARRLLSRPWLAALRRAEAARAAEAETARRRSAEAARRVFDECRRWKVETKATACGVPSGPGRTRAIRVMGSREMWALLAVTSSVSRMASPWIRAVMKTKAVTPRATPAINRAVWAGLENR